MTLPQGYYRPVLPPDPEWLPNAYLTPFMGSVPIITRLPPPDQMQNALDGVLRLEAGDVNPIKSTYGAAWDMSFLMHAYSTDDMEAQAISARAIALVAVATGLTIVGWYVVDVPTVIGGRRLSDPEIPENIVRYRSAVTWCVAGQPLTE